MEILMNKLISTLSVKKKKRLMIILELSRSRPENVEKDFKKIEEGTALHKL